MVEDTHQIQGVLCVFLIDFDGKMFGIHVPGSGSPPHPPCHGHGHGHNPSSPLPPVEWVGPGKGWASSNLQATAM